MSAKSLLKKARKPFNSTQGWQRFFNFAYSIGAAIVIWGALFKILHLPGGNTLLSIGMGTEVVMFILTAFDRPPREYKWENVFPALDKNKVDGDDDTDIAGADLADNTYTEVAQPSGVIYVGGNQSAGAPGAAAAPGVVPAAPTAEIAAAPDVATATADYLEQINAMTAEMRRLHESTAALNQVSDTLLESYRAITDNSENITRSSNGYVDQLTDLSRNIQGLNTIYEIQLKSISSQLDSIDRVNRGIKDIRDMYEKSAEQSSRYCEETEKMARYMQQLNQVYEKMIHAMTINMYNPMMGQAAANQAANNNDSNI